MRISALTRSAMLCAAVSLFAVATRYLPSHKAAFRYSITFLSSYRKIVRPTICLEVGLTDRRATRGSVRAGSGYRKLRLRLHRQNRILIT